MGLKSKIKKTPYGEEIARLYHERTASGFFLSFPKAGRTWMRLMLGRTMELHYGLEHPKMLRKLLKLHLLPKLNPDVPKIYVDHDDWPHWKTPSELTRHKRKYAHGRVLFLVRDPRDVVVSFYFEQSRRFSKEDAARQRRRHVVRLRRYLDRVRPYEGSISEFVREEVGSFRTILEYYNIWEENRNAVAAFHLAKYEDLKRDTAGELRRVVEFFGMNGVSDETIANAVEFCSFENMRRMERDNAFNTGKMAPTNKADNESYKTRKGKVGGYREYLTDEDVAWLNETMERQLNPSYGYVPEPVAPATSK